MKEKTMYKINDILKLGIITAITAFIYAVVKSILVMII